MVSVKFKSFVILSLTCWCINAQPSRKPPDLNRKMVKLMNTCFADRLNPVVTTPDLHDSFLEEWWQTLKPPMILIDKNFVASDARQHYSRFATFVFAPYSVESYEAMLAKARASPWWHKDSLFFIIGNLKDGCMSAEKILKHNWKMNSSSTLFLCHEGGRHAMLYDFNPYRNEAPLPWNHISDSEQPNTHWTMYKQKYHEGQKNCVSLMFNKATFMSKQGSDSSTRSESPQTKNRTPNLSNVINKKPIATSENIFQNLLLEIEFSAVLEHDHPCYRHDEEKMTFITKSINKSDDMSLEKIDSDVIVQRYNCGRVDTISTTCQPVLQQILSAGCKEPLIESYFDGILCDKHWSLERQIDSLKLLFRKSKYWHGSYSNQKNHHLKHRWIDKTSVKYRPIQLRDLNFALIVLQDGMYLSILVFILEICWDLATKIKMHMGKVNYYPNSAVHRIT